MRFIIHPGRVVAGDGDIHYISYMQLIKLYGVDPSKCIDGSRPGYRARPGDMHLRPRESGRYHTVHYYDEENDAED